MNCFIGWLLSRAVLAAAVAAAEVIHRYFLSAMTLKSSINQMILSAAQA